MEDQEERFKKYQEYDFRTDQEWFKYFDELYPTPSQKKVDKFKRKYYKRNIDPDFDVNYKKDDQP